MGAPPAVSREYPRARGAPACPPEASPPAPDAAPPWEQPPAPHGQEHRQLGSNTHHPLTGTGQGLRELPLQKRRGPGRGDPGLRAPAGLRQWLRPPQQWDPGPTRTHPAPRGPTVVTKGCLGSGPGRRAGLLSAGAGSFLGTKFAPKLTDRLVLAHLHLGLHLPQGPGCRLSPQRVLLVRGPRVGAQRVGLVRGQLPLLTVLHLPVVQAGDAGQGRAVFLRAGRPHSSPGRTCGPLMPPPACLATTLLLQLARPRAGRTRPLPGCSPCPGSRAWTR